MSAFIVDKAHIDAMIHAAAAVEHGQHTSGMRWWTVDDLRTVADYDACRRELSYSDQESQDRAGSMLWAENLRSIEYRYPDTIDNQCYPGPGDFMGWPDVFAYTCKGLRRTFDPVAILKAITCYEYQSCEHPGWKTSEARFFCDALKDKMIRNLPGYRDAAWEIQA